MRVAERAIKICVTVAILLSCVQATSSQTANNSKIQAGTVIEDVVIQSRPDQSYALFLPRNYTPEKVWPTVFCLDPRARGKSAIERFVPAAEKSGYIIICSNNSRNGLNWTTISQIFTDLWDDAHSRFSIDEKRTYAAGFSGGSRLAATYASRCRSCLAGVIGCGAGFPGDIAPDEKTSFAYFGAVGVDDFNFGEMWQLEKKLGKLTAPYHFENFDGGHEWPPQEIIEHALAWLTLQSMKTGTASKDTQFIEDQFVARMKAAGRMLSNQQFVDAARAYSSITRDFQGLREISTASEKAEQMNKSDELRKEAKAEEELYRQQLREAGEIRMLWMKPINLDDTGSSRADAVSRLAELKKRKDVSTDSRDRRLARRILSHLLIESYETSQSSLRNNDYATALANFQLVKELEPKSANVYYEIARVYALKHQKKAALQSLEDAIAMGFKDVSRMKADDALLTLADEPRFQKLLTTLTAP